jgi:hypothetical protein
VCTTPTPPRGRTVRPVRPPVRVGERLPRVTLADHGVARDMKEHSWNYVIWSTSRSRGRAELHESSGAVESRAVGAVGVDSESGEGSWRSAVRPDESGGAADPGLPFRVKKRDGNVNRIGYLADCGPVRKRWVGRRCPRRTPVQADTPAVSRTQLCWCVLCEDLISVMAAKAQQV